MTCPVSVVCRESGNPSTSMLSWRPDQPGNLDGLVLASTLDGMEERRSQEQSEPRLDGRRDTDPRLTTSDCAKTLGEAVSTQFIVGEINAGRLRGLIIRRPGKRAIYRVSPADLRAYQQLYCRASRRSA